jgi:hypothetical protein
MSDLTGFQFSQGSLQDFVDCRRRFQLRYLLRLAWPAVESEPVLENERFLQQGLAFHHLVQQHLLGVPPDRLETLIHEQDLELWWHNYLQSVPGLFPVGSAAAMPPEVQIHPEISLTAPLAGYRLVAKYDLVVLTGQGQALIFDWKTARRRPPRDRLAARLQTRLYPYLLVRAGAHLNQGAALQPEQVEMLYWFANFPDQPERFPYSAASFQADEAYLSSLIETIQRLPDSEFHLTDDERRCAYCVYRSLCDRGVRAGPLAAQEDELPPGELPLPDIDFEQIAEIAY